MDSKDTFFEPGFVYLRIEVNEDEFDYGDMASYQFGIHYHEYKKMDSYRPEKNTLMNFLGYLAIRLEWYGEAIFYSKEVLDNDNDNLNALENLSLIYRNMGWVKQELLTAKRIDQLQDVLRTNCNKAKVIKARCLTEKGFVLCKNAFNIHEDEFKTARELYSWALSNAADLVSVEEKVNWHFGRLTATQILYTKQTYWRNPSDNRTMMREYCQEFIEDSVEIFEHGDGVMKAKTWVKMAVFLNQVRKQKGHELDHTECLPPDIYRVYNKSNAAAACYNEAFKYKPGDPNIMAKKAVALYNKTYGKSDFPSAFDLLNKSIEADKSICNRLAFSSRAQAYRYLYRELLGKSRLSKDTQHVLCQLRTSIIGHVSDNWSLLIKAKSDLEISIAMHTDPGDCRLLGDIWFNLSKDSQYLHSRDGESKTHCLQKAVEYYDISVEMPAGSENSHTYWKRGECLRHMDRLKEAAESYKEAIRCQRFKTDSLEQAYKRLFAVYFLQIKGDVIADEELMRDAAECLKEGLNIFREEWQIQSTFCMQKEISLFTDRKLLNDHLDKFIQFCGGFEEYAGVVSIKYWGNRPRGQRTVY